MIFMHKTALPEDILNRVEKPARYVGGELNTIIKDKASVELRFAFCFPDVYDIGMGNLGVQILYDQFNHREDVWCERVYSPWPDLDKIMREESIPLFALESQDPVKDFDFLGITLQYEMCYTNVLQVLDLSGIPLLASERNEDDPIVIGGGPCTYNPEPIADFFDMFYIGEGEVSYDALFDLYIRMKKEGAARKDFLLAASAIEGIYVPSLYKPEYHEDGTLASFKPLSPGVPEKVRRVIVKEMDGARYPEKPIVPFLRPVQDRVTLEIMRGCIRGCRFCQAGMVYRPVRERSLDRLGQIASEALKSSGYDEISLSSLSSSDYSGIAPLVTGLIRDCAQERINISLPSLRIDSFSLDVMSKVQDIKKSSLTFAPEAGTQRLRDVINKGIREEDIMRGAAEAFHGGWTKVKFYFMLGLPTETEEDMKAIPELCQRVASLFFDEIPKEERKGKIQITASSSFFVPKPFTPFQWAVMEKKEEYLRRAHLVKDTFRAQVNARCLHYEYHDADVTLLEGVLARGDRRVGRVILKAYESGCLFDAWTEQFKDDLWQKAFDDCGIDPDFYTVRPRGEDELFPWDFIDIGVSKKFLFREWERAMQGLTTPKCLESCSGCGAASYGCGVCPSSPEREERHKKAEAAEQYLIAEKQTESQIQEKEEAGSARRTIRVRFGKEGALRYIGHLDVLRTFQKIFRRAGIPLAYSQGFSPHPIMSFALPLGLGLSSEGEYLDAEVDTSRYEAIPAEILKALRAASSKELPVYDVILLPEKSGNAMASVGRSAYRLYFPQEGINEIREASEQLLECETVMIQKQTKTQTVEMDLRPCLFELKTDAGESGEAFLYMEISAGSKENIKPELVWGLIKERAGLPNAEPSAIRRIDLMREDGSSLGEQPKEKKRG